MEAKWFNVNVQAQIWSGHADGHQKMGRLYPPAAVYVIEEYKGSFRFDEYKFVDDGEADLIERSSSYPQWWIRAADVSDLPFEDRVDDEPPVEDDLPGDDVVGVPSDETIGRVVRYLLFLLRS